MQTRLGLDSSGFIGVTEFTLVSPRNHRLGFALQTADAIFPESARKSTEALKNGRGKHPPSLSVTLSQCATKPFLIFIGFSQVSEQRSLWPSAFQQHRRKTQKDRELGENMVKSPGVTSRIRAYKIKYFLAYLACTWMKSLRINSSRAFEQKISEIGLYGSSCELQYDLQLV